VKRKRALDPYLYATADSPVDRRLMGQMKEQDETPASIDTSAPRFTLLVGPSPFTMPRGWEYYLTAPYEGASYIATVIHNAGYPIRIVDVRYSPNPLEIARREILSSTDVLGIATYEDNFPFVREIIDSTKEADPKMIIVCGGSLTTSVPHVFMQYSKTDILVISEGELTILELLESIARGTLAHDLPDIHGIVYRDSNGEVQRTPPRGQMTDLDCLPRMRLDLWPQARAPSGIQPQLITSFSRGCTMDCSFCFRTTPRVSAKSPEKFDAELCWLKEQYNTSFLFFSDLTFNADVRQTREICDVLEGYDFRWTSMCRCSYADPPRLAAMAKAGCDIILYGVESLGAEALKDVNKPTTESISIRAMRRTLEAGIRFGALLIVGLPGETAEGLDHMASWAEQHQHIVRVKYLQALPGTPIYYDWLRRGLIKSELDHLKWLSVEQSLPEDEFLNFNRFAEVDMRRTYQRIYEAYQPGPVMRFEHWPSHFEYFHPLPDNGAPHCVEYAGPNWRADFSSAGPPLIPGSERFTLSKTGPLGAVEYGAMLATSGAVRQAVSAKK